MSHLKRKKQLLKRFGFSKTNKAKRTPKDKKYSHMVIAEKGHQVKAIRFGQQGVRGAGKNPSSKRQKARRKSFKARHAKNIARGKMFPAYWANKVKW